MFKRPIREKHHVENAEFLVDDAPWLKAALFELDLRFQHVTHGNRNAVELLFKELKRRTEQSATHFRHATADSAQTWLQTFVFAWN
jgi:transposase-like protein